MGDVFTYNWQQSAAFKAHQNWIGQAVYDSNWIDASTRVAASFQTALNQHPAIVFIATGSSDISVQYDSQPLGAEWEVAADAIIQMVQMAQSANVKVILGNVAASGYNGDYFNGWLQTYPKAQGIPVVNFAYWVQNGCASVIPPPSSIGPVPCLVMKPSDGTPSNTLVLTDLGYEFITQLAQTVIATYGLNIKSGYLSDMVIDGTTGDSYVYQINNVQTGNGVQFTPQATWSDGVNRPMWNMPYNGAFNAAPMGTWWSTNPKVMAHHPAGPRSCLHVWDGYDLVQVGQRRNVCALDDDGLRVVRGPWRKRAGVLKVWKVYIAACGSWVAYIRLAKWVRED